MTAATTEARLDVLVPVAEELFALRAPDTVTWVPAIYYTPDDGSAYLRYGARANLEQS